MILPWRSAILAAVLAQLSGCALLYNYDAISQPPARGGVAEPMAPRSSSIQPALSIPLSALEGAANAAAGQVFPFTGDGAQTVAEIRVEVPIFGGCLLCASLGVRWDFTVTQPAPIRVEGEHNQLQIVLPAHVGGQAGFRGDLAPLFGLDKKNFEAAAAFRFRSGLRADEQFCPRLLAAELSYAWTTTPYLELVGNNCVLGICVGPWRLDLQSEVDEELRPMLQGVGATMQQALQCGPVRDALSKVWRSYSVPVTIPYEQLYLNIAPRAMYIPGVDVGGSEIVIAARLDADVSLDTAPAANQPLQLPPNSPLPIAPGRFSLAMPLSTQYYTINALIEQLLTGRKFSADTPVGAVTVRPVKVEVYPSGTQLAIGIAFIMEYQHRFLNSSATVWLTAQPVAIDAGRRLRLSDIRVTQKFSNPIWDIAALLMQDTIANAVADGFELDLNPPLNQAESQLKNIIDLAGQSSGIAMSASDVKIGVGRILTNDKAFQVEALLDAVVHAQLGAIPLDMKGERHD